MNSLDAAGVIRSTSWWEDNDPESAHRKYLQMHSSETNRSKIAIAEHPLAQYDWSGKSVLEYGCGGGYFTVWMAKRGAAVKAIEMNPNAVGAVEFYAREQGVADRVNVVCENAERYAEESHYDFIFAKDLIEHLQDDRPFFHRLGQQLRSRGRVYIATQNNHSLNYLLESTYERTYRGNKSWCGWDKDHRRFYNAPMLAQRLREAGIVPERWGSSYLFPWRFVTRRATGRLRPWRGWAQLDQALGTVSPFARWDWSIMVIGCKR